MSLGLLLLTVCAPTALASRAASAPTLAEEPDSPEALVGALAACLRDGDGPSLEALVDFPNHSTEGRLRGLASLDWERLDEAQQQAYRRDAVAAWLDDDAGFLRSATVYTFGEVPDPDAGQGPVPDRLVMKVVLKSTTRGQFRDLILYATRDLRLFALELGAAYDEGSNPQGAAGLQPRSFRGPVDLELSWSDEYDDFDRDDARELVGLLLGASDPDERASYAEFLHRSPHPGVAALLERLVAVDRDEPERTDVARLLVATIEVITGRHGGLPAPEEALSAEALHAELLAWVRWHDRQGWSFQPTRIVEPLERTFAERGLDDFPPRGRDPDEASDVPRPAATTPTDGAPHPLAGAPAPGAATEPGGATEPGSATELVGSQEPDAADPAPGGQPAAPPPLSPAPPPPPPLPAGAAPEDTEADTGDDVPRTRPSVRFHLPDEPEDEDEAPSEAQGFEVLLVPPKGSGKPRSLPVEEATASLPPAIVETLDTWSGLLVELQARVAFGGDAELLVVGRCDDELFIEALDVLGQARRLVDGLLPRLGQRPVKPVVVVLADREFMRTEFWGVLLTGLAKRQLITFEAAAALQRDPSGFTNRTEGLFVQPTADMAGDAANGDDEFRLANELAHKLVGCLAVRRAGFLPDGLLWALGHFAEQRLFDSVYQFNKSGFVATADHFDWPRQARKVLEKRAKRRQFDLAEDFLDSGAPSGEIDGHLLAWGTLDYLAEQRATDLVALIADLEELHSQARPLGGASRYEGDRQATLQALRVRLGPDPVDEVLDHLKRLD